MIYQLPNNTYPTYKEWLAEQLDMEIEDITGLDMDSDSRSIYNNIYLPSDIEASE